MDNIHINIVKEDSNLVIKTEVSVLGSQYDNFAKQFVFTRPPEHVDDRLILAFRGEEVSVDIGSANVYPVMKNLTQKLQLEMQVAFRREETQTAHSNTLTFTLRPSLKASDLPVSDWPKLIREISEKAVCDVHRVGDELAFYDLFGEEVARVDDLSEAALSGVSYEQGVLTFTNSQGEVVASFAITGSGFDGWTPVLANVASGTRVVQQVADWTGGTGVKPAVGQYIGSGGFVTNIAQATDIRGPQGTGVTGLTDTQKELVMSSVQKNNARVKVDNLVLGVVADTHARSATDTGASDFRSLTRTLTNLEELALVSKMSGLDGIVHLGDVQDGTTYTKAEALSAFTQMGQVLAQSRAPVFVIPGNHDDNSDQYHTAAWVVTKGEWNGSFLRIFEPQNGVVHDTAAPNSAYYYKDFAAQKIRAVFLDFLDYPWVYSSGTTLKYWGDSQTSGWGYGARQVHWLHEEALDFSAKSDAADWATLVFSHSREHSITGTNFKNAEIVMKILDAYNKKESYIYSGTTADWAVSGTADFTGDATGGLLGFIQGHLHADFTIPPNGSIGAASWQINPYSYQISGVAAGYHDKDGFCELMVVDRAAKTIHVTAICAAGAVSANYLAERVIPIPDVYVPPAPGLALAQGSYTYNGVTVTVAGTHITMNGTSTGVTASISQQIKLTGAFAGALYEVSTFPTSPWVSETFLAVTQGVQHKAVIKNITGTTNAPTTLTVIRPYFSNGARVTAACPSLTNNNPTGGACPTDMLACIAVVIGSASNATWNDYQFDIELWIAGEKVLG